MQNRRLIVPTPGQLHIESWDVWPQRPVLDRDRQNLPKRLRHKRYAEASRLPRGWNSL